MNKELTEKISRAHGILDEAHKEHDPIEVWGMFSGGYDSLVCAHVVDQWASEKMDAVVHINTGIGVPQTRDYVRETAKKLGWELREYRAADYVRGDGTPDPQIYEDLVQEFGFPGPVHHRKMFNRLKGRAINMAIRETKTERFDRIMLCTGIRRDESDRRSRIKDPVDRKGAKVWTNPILDFTKQDIREYMHLHDLPLNEVVELLCMSGECLCGAYAKPGELEKIDTCYPEVAERIRRIQDSVSHPWGWEEAPPGWWSKWKRGESFLPGVEPDSLDESMLCHDCKKE